MLHNIYDVAYFLCVCLVFANGRIYSVQTSSRGAKKKHYDSQANVEYTMVTAVNKRDVLIYQT